MLSAEQMDIGLWAANSRMHSRTSGSAKAPQSKPSVFVQHFFAGWMPYQQHQSIQNEIPHDCYKPGNPQ